MAFAPPISPADLDVASLAQCVVFDEAETRVRLGSLWVEKPTALIFLRHFACMACRAHVAETLRVRSQIEAQGIRLALIGNGAPGYIAKFREDVGLEPGLVFTDPSLISFRLAGFKRGFLASHGPRSVVGAARLLLQGNKQAMPTRETGDIWQLGGTLVVEPSGRVRYHYISQAIGDFGPSVDLASAAESGDV